MQCSAYLLEKHTFCNLLEELSYFLGEVVNSLVVNNDLLMYCWLLQQSRYECQSQFILTLSAPCIPESCIKIKINLNFYFRTSLWCLKWFYEGL